MECLCRKCAKRARPRKTLLSRQSLRTLFVRSRYALFIEMVRSLCQRRRCSCSFMFVHVRSRSFMKRCRQQSAQRACASAFIRRSASERTTWSVCENLLAPQCIFLQSRAGGKQSVAKYFSGLVFMARFQVYRG